MIPHPEYEYPLKVALALCKLGRQKTVSPLLCICLLTTTNLLHFQPTPLTTSTFEGPQQLPTTATDAPDHHEKDQEKAHNTLVTINTPSSSFGTVVHRADELMKQYPFAFYESPMNVKQREVNKWGLKMASSSRHRFIKKKEHEDWCKKEIRLRGEIIISLSEKNELVGDSKYFQLRNIPTRLHKLTKENEDLERLTPETIKRYQCERYRVNCYQIVT